LNDLISKLAFYIIFANCIVMWIVSITGNYVRSRNRNHSFIVASL